MLYDNNLVEWSVRLNRSKPLFRTILEQRRFGLRARTRNDIRLRRNLPNSFMIVRQKPQHTFIFRVIPAMNIDFHSQT